jgi:hypothetical protein
VPLDPRPSTANTASNGEPTILDDSDIVSIGTAAARGGSRRTHRRVFRDFAPSLPLGDLETPVSVRHHSISVDNRDGYPSCVDDLRRETEKGDRPSQLRLGQHCRKRKSFTATTPVQSRVSTQSRRSTTSSSTEAEWDSPEEGDTRQKWPTLWKLTYGPCSI